ncbi:YraN family protein [Pseudomaricurvus sp. HS19]|uniref:YraN family protein n=1 Tax=Pseudomaricurvus sp. HS19 TaxID=2692626 RepID=UPI0013A87CF8|nr:YraN family protein [Pseudomaricurvus sp. HS19]MYM64675.1 YraN family protein [Pseudomaricurvus sp. HS19]
MFGKPGSGSKLRSPRQRTGAEHEQAAEQFLLQQGLTLLQRNFWCKLGEIDLIMRDGEQLVFIEVRYRKHAGYGLAQETVTAAKQRKLVRAAQYYLLHNGSDDPPCRFDVVAVHQQQPLEWIRNAFGAE